MSSPDAYLRAASLHMEKEMRALLGGRSLLLRALQAHQNLRQKKGHRWPFFAQSKITCLAKTRQSLRRAQFSIP